MIHMKMLRRLLYILPVIGIMIAVGMGGAPIAINQAIQYIDPDGKNRPVHSTSLIEE